MGKVTVNLATYAHSSAPAAGSNSDSGPKAWSNPENLQLPVEDDALKKKEVGGGKGRIDWNRVNSPTLVI